MLGVGLMMANDEPSTILCNRKCTGRWAHKDCPVHAAPTDNAVRLTGLVPGGGQILVTIWDEHGTLQRILSMLGRELDGEVALRWDQNTTWGAPAPIRQEIQP
jgi:hypothetical protein